MKISSIITRSLLIILGLGVILIIFLNIYKGPTSQLQLTDQSPSKALIDQGAYLAQIGDCTSCHTSDTKQPFAGGVPFEMPIGTVYSPNITPDKTHGIGNYSLEEFDNAIRYGIRKDGKSLYPAMPFPDYAVISEADIKALYAYFMNSVQPSATPRMKAEITWPLSMRWPLTAWRLMFSPTPKEFDTSRYPTSQIARGAYLVQGLGHCGSCHTPRSLTLNEKGYNESDPAFLSGSNVAIDGWVPINLRGDHITGLGDISADELAILLWSGRSERHAVFGGMREVIDNSLQFATKDDIISIAKYLKTLSPVNSLNPPFVYDETTHLALSSGNDSMRGASIYLDACAACHRTTGLGYSEVFPALAGNPSVQADKIDSLVKIIAEGSTLHGTEHALTTFVMPNELNDRLNDTDIADVLTFIRTSWGNQGKAVSLKDVQTILKH